MMKKVYHPDLGNCVLTTKHAASSYGQPVLVDRSGKAYGCGDLDFTKIIDRAERARQIGRDIIKESLKTVERNLRKKKGGKNGRIS